MALETYKRLESHFADVVALRQVESLLDWDRSVMMPPRGGAQRARQMAVLGVKIHALQAASEVGEWIARVNRGALDEWQQANLDVMSWLHRHATAVPAALVERKVVQESATELAWRTARRDSDFAMVLPELEKMLAATRDYGAAKAAALGVPVYDALMDAYVPHMPSAEVDAIFDDLAAFLPGAISVALDRQGEPLPLRGPFPAPAQEALCRDLAAMLGFDFSRGRLDTSAHPFSMGIGDDVRITSRYTEDGFIEALRTVAHETGHGLYDRHTPARWHHQPVGASQNMGMAVHESQALSLDMQLSRRREFWEIMAPRAQAAFGREEDPAFSARNLHRHALRVSRSLIRVEADELTYPAHIIFRYRLEKDMVEGKLEARDLPEAWRAGISALVGVSPPDDRRGCLQDIHWYAGHFGYFPAYALGAVIAAQFAARMEQDIPGLSARLHEEGLGVFTGWLRDNVQARACLYRPQDLLKAVTGQKLSTAAFKAHITRRYMEERA